MNLQEYYYNHPDRLSNLDRSEQFFAVADDNPIHPSLEGGLIDVVSLFLCLPSRGGKAYRTFPSQLLTYLKSGKNLAHPSDTFEVFYTATSEIQLAYSADKSTYPARSDPSLSAPFFVHPETAFGFLRKYLHGSPQLYGQQLALTSTMITEPVKRLMQASFARIKELDPVAASFAARGLSLRVRAGVSILDDGKSTATVMVQLVRGGEVAISAKMPAEISDDQTIIMPTFADMLDEPDISKALHGMRA
jgi:hypothetical protein